MYSFRFFSLNFDWKLCWYQLFGKFLILKGAVAYYQEKALNIVNILRWYLKSTCHGGFFFQYKTTGLGDSNQTLSLNDAFIVKTQRNSTQLKATQKQLRWVRHSSHLEPTPPQTFQALLDQLESWNLVQTLTRPIWLR